MPSNRRVVGPQESQPPPGVCWGAGKVKLVDGEGLRADGRSVDDIRPMYVKEGVVSRANGSAYVEMKHTKVICAVYGPRDVGRREEFSMKGKLSCDFQFLPFAGTLRRPPGEDFDHKDISSRLVQTFESVVCLDRFPKAQVDICVNVLQDDGSAFAAAVTCASAALADAGVEMFDIATGCSARVQNDRILLDPTLDEERYYTDITDSSSLSSGLVTIALMPSQNEIAFISLCGEVDAVALVKATRSCSDGCVRVHDVIRQSLVQSTSQRQKYSQAK